LRAAHDRYLIGQTGIPSAEQSEQPFRTIPSRLG